MAQRKTKPGTRKLSEVARKLVVPSGIVSSGWPAVRDTCREKLGVGFDEWQQGAGRLILGKRADGKLACMIGGAGMSVCRQVGKTYLWSGILFGLAINNPGMLIIWSAHHARTHGETFISMQAFADRSRIRPYIKAVYTGSGDEEIRFRNGSRILFGARERGFGRGIPGVDVIMADEGQIMSEKALDAQMATLNTSYFGLFATAGTPPRPEDNSESWMRMRSEAWAGTLEDAVWIEIGAAPGTDPNDRKLWPVWNPSHPHRTPVESILRLQRKLSPDSFLREGMGMYPEDAADIFGDGKWSGCKVEVASPPTVELKLGIAVSYDRAWTSIGVAARYGSRIFVGGNKRDRGTSWAPEHVADVQRRLGCAVLIDGGGPGASLIRPLEEAGVRLTILGTKDMLDAVEGFYDRVQDARIAQADDPVLNEAVKGAAWRDVGDRRAIGRRKSTADPSMLEAVVLPAWDLWRNDDYDVLDSVLLDRKGL